MITPGAVRGAVHALLARAGGFHQEAIHVHDGSLQGGRGLIRPDPAAGVAEDIEQGPDVLWGQAPAEGARGGGVGQAAGAQGVEQDLIVAKQLQVSQAGAATEGQVCQGRDVVRFTVGEVGLQHLQAAAEGVHQAEAPDQGMHGPEAAHADAATPLGNFIVDGAGGHHGLRATAQVGLIQAAARCGACG